MVALLDLLLLTRVIRQGPLVPRWPFLRPPSGPAGEAHAAGATDFATREAPPEPRPEARPEEPDLIIESIGPGAAFPALPGRRRGRRRPAARGRPGGQPTGSGN